MTFVGTSSGRLSNFNTCFLSGFSSISTYLSFPSLSFLYSFSIFPLSLVVFRVMLKCPGTPTSPTLDTLCTCWSTPIPRNSFNSSSSKSVPSSSSVLATCMVRNLANAGPCLVVVVSLFSFFSWDSLRVASTSASSTPGGATYLNSRLVFFLIFEWASVKSVQKVFLIKVKLLY